MTFIQSRQKVYGSQTNISGNVSGNSSSERGNYQRVIGDLVENAFANEYDVIVHGCNCFHTMGAGIARTISQRLPQSWEADRLTLLGDRNKLGNFSLARGVSSYGKPFAIVNAYTQYTCFGHGPLVDYDAIGNVFKKIAIAFDGAHIAYPLLGCGLAGGDWNIVEALIERELDNQRHTLVVFNKQEWNKWFPTMS